MIYLNREWYFTIEVMMYAGHHIFSRVANICGYEKI